MLNLKDSNLTTEEKISFLQRFILVHSFIYYELNRNLISDKDYDWNSKLLVNMQAEYKTESANSDYWYVFKDFDGNTGFDLYHTLTEKDKNRIRQIALSILKNS